MTTNGRRKVCLQLSVGLYRDIKVQAILHDMTIVALVESALKDYLDRYQQSVIPPKRERAKRGGGAGA